jgi:uncharacterized membrane protein
MFVTFLHGMAKMLRVQYLLNRVTDQGRAAIEVAFPQPGAYSLAPSPDAGDGAMVRNGSRAGVLQSVDREALVRLAAERGAHIELLVEVGEYIAVATPIAIVRGGVDGSVTGNDIASGFLLGGERTLIQDPGFVFRQLVDVAIRALSPAVNDPTTGVQAIDRMVDLLATISGRPDPSGWFVDEAGNTRLHCREPSLGRLVDLAFVEVIRYGADSPQVVRRLRAAFDVLSALGQASTVDVIDGLRATLEEAQTQTMPTAFIEISAIPDRHGLG